MLHIDDPLRPWREDLGPTKWALPTLVEPRANALLMEATSEGDGLALVRGSSALTKELRVKAERQHDGEVVHSKASEANLRVRERGQLGISPAWRTQTHRAIDTSYADNAELLLDLAVLIDPPSLQLDSGHCERFELLEGGPGGLGGSHHFPEKVEVLQRVGRGWRENGSAGKQERKVGSGKRTSKFVPTT